MTDKQQTIFRAAHKNHPYFPYRRATAQDKRVTFEARGLLALLLSRPDDWVLNRQELQTQAPKCGRDKLDRLIDELVEFGYLELQDQQHDSDGHFTKRLYFVYEIPLTEKPLAAQPDTGETDPYIKENLENLEDTEDSSKELSFQPSGDGWAGGDMAFIFHEESYQFEQVTIRAADDGIYTPSGMIRITTADGKNTSRDPKNIYAEPQLLGDPVSSLTDVQRVIAVLGYGMATTDIVTETRAKRINLIVGELRQTFANQPVAHGELYGAYNWLATQPRSIPPVDPVAVCNLVVKYRTHKRKTAGALPSTTQQFNPDSFSSGG